MDKEIKITKKVPRRGDDGYKVVSVRMREEMLERLDALEPDDIDALAAQVLVPEKTALAAAGQVKPSKAYRGMYGG